MTHARRHLALASAAALVASGAPFLGSGAATAIPLPEECTTKTYAGFASHGDLTLNGSAAVVSSGDGDVLRVTPAQLDQAGSAFTTQKLTLLNDGSFSSSFSFRFSNQYGGGADGIVFTVQTVDNTAGGTGGGIGYMGLSPSLGVEFDNWHNGDRGDINDNHVGIDEDGSVSSVTQADLATVGVSLDDSSVVKHAWVDYNGTTNTLEVRVANTSTRPAVAILTRVVDLPQLLGNVDDAFVGFTSGTGAAAANHDVIDWSFSNCYRPAGVDSPPFVDAGGPYTGLEDSAAPVAGSVTDDLGIASRLWTAAGPGGCVFADPTAVVTTVTCDQPGAYTLTLAGTDTAGQTASDTAALQVAAVNRAPEAGSVSLETGSGCSVTATVHFTDPDASDTHTVSFDWGDGATSPGSVDEVAGTGTGTHTYAGVGTYDIEATVSDGALADSTTESYTTRNTAGAFLAPINAAGTRSVFRKGSTIPVKILITDCEDHVVSGLRPVVHLDQTDGNPNAAVNETQILESATNGKAMVWNGTHYQYNLSTKNSQFFNGADLSAGSYRISVTDPSLSSPATVVVDLR